MANLMLHSGGKAIERETLEMVETPVGSGRWQPIPHYTLFNLVDQTILQNGLQIENVQMGIAKDGARFFALMDISSDMTGYRLTIGLRNSHDKMFPAGMVVGSRVFVCDNLAFSGEISIARKHTIHIMDDLPGLVVGAVGKIAIAKQSQDKRIELYKEYFIDDYDVHDMVIKSVDYGIIPNQAIPAVLKEWREPSFEDFKSRTAWSLFNAFTFIGKRFPVSELAKRTVKLHGLFDIFTGFEREE